MWPETLLLEWSRYGNCVPGKDHEHATAGSLCIRLPCAGLVAYDTKLLSCEELGGAEGAGSSTSSSSGLPDEPYRYLLVFGERRAAAHTTASSSSNAGMSTSGGDSQARGGQAGPEDSASGFDAGLEVRAKVVVGADGYFSRVRREVRGWVVRCVVGRNGAVPDSDGCPACEKLVALQHVWEREAFLFACVA